jgi:hypothetical protein
MNEGSGLHLAANIPEREAAPRILRRSARSPLEQKGNICH